MIIGTKANVPVTTLTENCWKTCNHFDVDTTGFYTKENSYYTFCACKNLNLCKHAADAFEKDRFGLQKDKEET